MNTPAITIALTAVMGVMGVAAPAFAAEPEDAPVKVFLLAGQSNMEGKGAANTLPWLGEDPKYGHLLAGIRDGENWRTRDDVFIDYLGRRGPLGVGFGSDGGPHGPRIGPEYGFGMVVGDHFDEPVLIIKTAWGGKDVANDFRAPSRPDGAGEFYTKMIDHTRDVLSRSGELFPELAGRDCELAGFVWFQGWNDMVNREKTDAYTENLAQMIRDLRRDLKAPNLPVIIGGLGSGGDEPGANIARFREQQRAVAELPEFAGNVRFVPTAPYWDDVAHEMFKQDVWKGPEKERFYRIASDRPYHYLGSGKIYYLIGHAFGTEMIDMMGATPAEPPSDLWVTYTGASGSGAGKHIVLISGDEEYRSEEALPQLGRILAAHHGFTCTVLFAIDEETGVIDPNNRHNIPGLAALENADLMIIATRFRDLPDDQMAHIDAYLKAGKPVIGMRTATHGFNIRPESKFHRYTWNSQAEDYSQGFGRQVLGETWVAHHGHHGVESTRGVIAPGASDHPITRGLAPKSVWGPTDVYKVRLPLPGDSQPIILGQVLDGMSIDDDPVENEKNEPMMPVGWTKTYAGENGVSGRVFATTMGAATDLLAAGTRRMIVNGVYWALGMENDIPAAGTEVGLVGEYGPSPFGFGGSRKGVRPSEHKLKTR